MIKQIEKWTRIIYIALMKVSLPGVFLPKLCVSCVRYFTTNLGNDAFVPVFGMM